MSLFRFSFHTRLRAPVLSLLSFMMFLSVFAGELEHVDEANFSTRVLENQKLVIAVFTAQWCGPCKILAPILEQLAAEGAGKYEIFKIDLDKNQKLASRYDVNGVPALLFFKNGELIQIKMGALSKQTLEAEIFKLLTFNKTDSSDLIRTKVVAEASSIDIKNAEAVNGQLRTMLERKFPIVQQQDGKAGPQVDESLDFLEFAASASSFLADFSYQEVADALLIRLQIEILRGVDAPYFYKSLLNSLSQVATPNLVPKLVELRQLFAASGPRSIICSEIDEAFNDCIENVSRGRNPKLVSLPYSARKSLVSAGTIEATGQSLGSTANTSYDVIVHSNEGMQVMALGDVNNERTILYLPPTIARQFEKANALRENLIEREVLGRGVWISDSTSDPLLFQFVPLDKKINLNGVSELEIYDAPWGFGNYIAKLYAPDLRAIVGKLGPQPKAADLVQQVCTVRCMGYLEYVTRKE